MPDAVVSAYSLEAVTQEVRRGGARTVASVGKQDSHRGDGMRPRSGKEWVGLAGAVAVERAGAVTMKGNAVTLVGPRIQAGMNAPAFRVVDTDLKERTLDDYRGNVLLIAAVPSLDTGVCDAETRRFNQEATGFGPDVRVLTISMDLPFAQKRWCGAAGIDRVITLSDHREASFGTAYGTLIKELRLLARAVFVVDRTGKVTYVEYVPEVTAHPQYEAAVQAVRQAEAVR